MAEQKVELRKIRDFGEIVNDAFLFIRQNYKPLLVSFFAINAVVFIILAVLYGLYISKYDGGFNETGFGEPVEVEFSFGFFSPGFLFVVFMLVTIDVMKVVLGAYLKYYVENNGGKPGIEEVWVIFKKYFFHVLLYGIPITALTLFGLSLFFIPGIFLWVAFLPFPMVVMMENKNFIQACQRCFQLVSDNFWTSFGIYITGFIISAFSSGILKWLLTYIFELLKYLIPESLETMEKIILSFSNILSISFYIIFFLCIALQYFNLAEKKDGTGLLNRIDAMGNHRTNFDNIEEHY